MGGINGPAGGLGTFGKPKPFGASNEVDDEGSENGEDEERSSSFGTGMRRSHSFSRIMSSSSPVVSTQSTSRVEYVSL